MKRTLLLVFGGESAEHEVSIRSARNVYAALNAANYAIILCYIDKQGCWWGVDTIESEPHRRTVLTPLLGGKAMRIGDREQTIDALVPILHGPNGEDGSIQGLSQLMHVPVVGCGIVGSAICMDKDVAKRLLKQAGIAVVDYVIHRQGQPDPSYEKLRMSLGDTLFVKPANLGSSVGVARVTNAAELQTALTTAHEHDQKVLIERAIVGRELECAILGNDQPEASVVGEILPGDTFYSYDDKYAEKSQAKTSTNTHLPADTLEVIRQTAITAYTALECRGLSRVDFFLAEDGTIYINEINTMPGFTDISMYPQLWRASGLESPALLDKLVDLALQ